MLSPADMLIIGAVALIAFGPDQLPKVARRAGQVMRDVQNTSQGFIREMERAADDVDFTRDTVRAPDAPMYGQMSEPTHAPDPFVSHDTFEHATVPAATKSVADRPKYSASESGSGFAREDSSGI